MNDKKNIKNIIWDSTLEIPAYNFLYFEMYMSLARLDLEANENESNFLKKIATLIAANGKLDSIITLIENRINAIFAYRNQSEIPPYICRAFDCLHKNLPNEYANLKNDTISYTYSMYPMPFIREQCIETDNLYSTEINDFFGNESFMLKSRLSLKGYYNEVINSIAQIDLDSENVYEDFIKNMLIINHKHNTPIQEFDFKKESIMNMFAVSRNLDYKNIEYLKSISAMQYYHDVKDANEQNERIRIQNAQKKI